MVSRPTGRKALDGAVAMGENLVAWRKLLRLTAAQVADRAGIARGTLARLEHGDPGVNVAALLSVANALGQLDRLVDATDPYLTDFGRARAEQALPQRVRR